MLVDPTPPPEHLRDPILKALAGINSAAAAGPTRLQQGVWDTGFNGERAFLEKLDDPISMHHREARKDIDEEDFGARYEAMIAYEKSLEERYPKEFGRKLGPMAGLGFYGVADSVEQILETYPHLAVDPEPFVITIGVVEKKDQSPTGGWRWHKWGPYIGNKRETYPDYEMEGFHEYLYDEPHVERVLCFHVYQITEDIDSKRFKKISDHPENLADTEAHAILYVLEDQLRKWAGAGVQPEWKGPVFKAPYPDGSLIALRSSRTKMEFSGMDEDRGRYRAHDQLDHLLKGLDFAAYGIPLEKRGQCVETRNGNLYHLADGSSVIIAACEPKETAHG